MSFGWTAAVWWQVGAAVVGAGAAVKQADTARRNGNIANDQAMAAAKKQQMASDQANNRANAKSPDSAALMATNMMAAKGGQSGTMLTGPSGIDPGALTLGKNSLLGG